MSAILILIPFLSALLGWLVISIVGWLVFHPEKPIKIGPFVLQGLLYRKEPQLKQQLAAVILKDVPAWEEAAIKLVTAANLDKIRPELNEHIDLFLKVRLKQAMPIIGSLIGERTIGQLKALFMEELETLFPSVMKSYISHLKNDIDVDQLVREKVNSYSFKDASRIIKNNFSQTLGKVSMVATLIGFILGCIESLVIILLLP